MNITTEYKLTLSDREFLALYRLLGNMSDADYARLLGTVKNGELQALHALYEAMFKQIEGK